MAINNLVKLINSVGSGLSAGKFFLEAAKAAVKEGQPDVARLLVDLGKEYKKLTAADSRRAISTSAARFAPTASKEKATFARAEAWAGTLMKLFESKTPLAQETAVAWLQDVAKYIDIFGRNE